MNREFEIAPRQAGGWRLSLIEGDLEVGGGIFEDEEYDLALDAGEAFVGEQP